MCLRTNVILDVTMELWSPFFHRFKRIKNSRKLFIFDFDKIQGFLCNVFIDGSNSSHLISNVTHFILSQWGLIPGDGGKSILKAPWKIFTCNDGPYPRKFQRLPCVDIQNLCMGDSAS